MAGALAPIDLEHMRQHRALGDPTRHAVFVHLREAERPVDVAELTAKFGLNHNAIRQHLARLADAGLITDELRASTGPGRPAKLYRVVPGAAQRWGGTSPHETLADMLLEMVRTGRSALEIGRDTGRRLAADNAPAGSAVEILDGVARRLGFEPCVELTERGADIVLGRCPFVDPATAAPEVVCALHRGIAEGIAEATDTDDVIEDLVMRPPAAAGCRIRVASSN